MDNYSIVKSWVQMKKVKYLQDRNPGVPGIIYKLEDEENKVRKLEKVRELWLAYETASGMNICDLYSGERISLNRLSIDHFVPWSYVASDELWNLVPMEKGITPVREIVCQSGIASFHAYRQHNIIFISWFFLMSLCVKDLRLAEYRILMLFGQVKLYMYLVIQESGLKIF